MKLNIAKEISLPLDAVTRRIGFIGTIGSGKTYGAGKLIEEMEEAKAQYIILDPVGIWWGLRLAADGKNPGISIPVFGGLHGDIPLEYTAGRLVADLIVDRGISIILDISQFEYDTQKTKFAIDFADRFFFRKKASPSAVHIVLEECQEFVPQNPQREEGKMLHSFTRMWKIGRNFGIGGSLISQRPQEVNKKVLNLSELVFAFRTTGTHEKKAVVEWMKDKGLDLDLAEDLPKLEVGVPHLWSPGWLGESKQVHINKKWTFDASSTPEVGKRAEVKELAKIDLANLSKAMSATIEKAKENDPVELKKKIRGLELEVKKKQPGKAISVQDNSLKEENTKLRKDVHTLQQQSKKNEAEQKRIFSGIKKAIESIANLLNYEIPVLEIKESEIPPIRIPGSKLKVEFKPSGNVELKNNGTGSLGRCPLMILKFLALRPDSSFSKEQVGAITGYSPRSGGFNNAISQLAVKNLIIRSGGRLQLNQGNIHEAILELGSEYNAPEQYSKEDWLQKLGQCPQKVYQLLLENPGRLFTKEEIGELTNYSSGSGGFNNAISKLCTLGLAERYNGQIRLNQELLEV